MKALFLLFLYFATVVAAVAVGHLFGDQISAKVRQYQQRKVS
jgi:hypothetical protein